MATGTLWRAPEGLSIINSVISQRIPQWKDGLRPHQLESISLILDHQDLLCCVATGSRKTALYMVPILVHQELDNNPSLYPEDYVKKAHRLPVGVVVTPTKGLACNLVRSP